MKKIPPNEVELKSDIEKMSDILVQQLYREIYDPSLAEWYNPSRYSKKFLRPEFFGRIVLSGLQL